MPRLMRGSGRSLLAFWCALFLFMLPFAMWIFPTAWQKAGAGCFFVLEIAACFVASMDEDARTATQGLVCSLVVLDVTLIAGEIAALAGGHSPLSLVRLLIAVPVVRWSLLGCIAMVSAGAIRLTACLRSPARKASRCGPGSA